MLATFNIEYIAGLFDGEGCISIGTYESYGNKQYRLSVEIGLLRSERVLKQLKQQFGGVLRVKENCGWSKKSIPYWSVNCREALAFLKSIQPYIVIKSRQCALAIQFYDEGQWKTGHKVTDEELGRRERIRNEIHKMNKFLPPFTF